ncbi:hypothetical protein LIA77_06848 [Sarocladium implicatum]|nr:hypothetical protein LIA77_06848 [Sarocladium implicatum]
MASFLNNPATEGNNPSSGSLQQSADVADDQLFCWCCLIDWHSQESKATGCAAKMRSKRTGNYWKEFVLSLEARCIRRSILAYLGTYWDRVGRALTRENADSAGLVGYEPLPDGSMHPHVALVFEVRRDLKLEREQEEAQWSSDSETVYSDFESSGYYSM